MNTNIYSKNNIFTSRKKINKDIACTNCGSKRHIYKHCPEPITSWGMILVTYGDMIKPIHGDNNEQVDLNDADMIKSQTRVLIESNIDRFIVSKAYHNIKFLMISRKNSVGYVEFIRGRYRPEKIDKVIYLFKQMMQSEIDKINYSLTINKGFDYLWRDFWGNKADSPFLLNDKNVSRTNYDMLKVTGVEGPELNLKYIVSTVKAEYCIEEWGFPKGRKNKIETEKECAIREFKEESGYLDEDFEIINDIKPLIEEFIGTNGIKYKHIYYVAELVSNKTPKNNITDSQRDEIGNVQFMDFTSAHECIRDYHISRKILLVKLFTYYLDRLVLSNREQSTNNILNKLSINKSLNDNSHKNVNIVDENIEDENNLDRISMLLNMNNDPDDSVEIIIKKQNSSNTFNHSPKNNVQSELLTLNNNQ